MDSERLGLGKNTPLRRLWNPLSVRFSVSPLLLPLIKELRLLPRFLTRASERVNDVRFLRQAIHEKQQGFPWSVVAVVRVARSGESVS